jgi:hypothetical protein
MSAAIEEIKYNDLFLTFSLTVIVSILRMKRSDLFKAKIGEIVLIVCFVLLWDFVNSILNAKAMFLDNWYMVYPVLICLAKFNYLILDKLEARE